MFKYALEIGGPSRVFYPGGPVPIYPQVECIDDVDFAGGTEWSGLQNTFPPRGNRPGQRFISEGSTLDGVPAKKYDLLLASHCLEHMANPLQALQNWLPYLTPGAHLCVIVPDSRFTFDHRRPVTPFEHLLDDLKTGVGEDDLTHLPEILKLHDLSQDPPAGDLANFEKRSRDNFKNRCLHQHVFNANTLAQSLIHTGLLIQQVTHAAPFHVIGIARMPA